MRMYCIWASPDGSWEAATLVTAWDEFAIDENPDGYAEELEKAKAQGQVREVVVKVDDAALAKVFEVPELEGEVN